MTSILRLGAIALLASSLSQSVIAKERLTFGTQTLKAYDACSFRMSSALIFGDEPHYQATRACIETETGKAKESFPSALASVRAATSLLLKDYYAAWLASMRALATLQIGTKNDADRAYADAKSRLTEMWTKVEIESEN